MITGEKVKLRLFQSEEDLLYSINNFNDLDERGGMDHTELYSPIERMKQFKESGLWTRNNGTLLITTMDGKVVGSISFGRKSEFELSIGYRIIKEEDRNRGYMTEALKLFSSYLFETTPLITRLSLYTAEDNHSSRRLAEKCGYVQEGILRNAYFYRGRVCNWVIYSILRGEI